MILKLLGLLDLIIGLHLILLKWDFFPSLGIVFAVYLFIKSIAFFHDVASIVDLLTAVIYTLAVYDIYFSFTWIFSLWLLQKSFFSLVVFD